MLDRFIIEFDKGLRTLLAPAHSRRPYPDHALDEQLSDQQEKRHAAALMRINHSGEVCAQALYSGQSLSARNPDTARALQQAAEEETEHLAWCEKRIKELGSHTSVLNPIFYGGSFGLGLLAGCLGDKWNLGFLAETERQVGQHLTEHLNKFPVQDIKSQAIIQQMRADEAAHADSAIAHGAAELPLPIRATMRLFSNIMTTTTYHL
ncbi:2-polyprenyl-3-methyl-6-methoxy-1,4-benzoquinone monooxygenase [Methylobacillus gramineus]|uniref:2-polyprenyl-3-methyl-6-methoxy-1,4-benzoquinone monooxygenase n=1 Tax=Methylobacillus gramineus TaxID=755169 RepID=UPI001CFF8E52|nr:2-polyprenyl-3-methyl-6-methoxy-1,4-benzoquinone monooxygenase [Methylobacillus gramineus]MCB5185288.1 2-polyprenyl-3-methyl-6-methoxy-1,4-benzoquinone monooxygenase [Methylobacillus gramineus]